MPRKRKSRKVEASTALVPLALYRDETSCRRAIRYLEQQLARAYEVLAGLLRAKGT